MLDRRTLLAALALSPIAPATTMARALMTVFKDPKCGCCGTWVDHVRARGFQAEVQIETQMERVKMRLGVPVDLVSCHTATVEGYAVEGHVPAEAIERLLRERPALAGIAVPGMPIGSPGMEVQGQAPDPFKVIGFTAAGGRLVFADYPRGYGAI
jgi:hypothetical protein